MRCVIMNSLDPILNQEQLAEYLGVSIYTLRTWRNKGEGPKFIRLGRKIAYRTEDIEAYLNRDSIACVEPEYVKELCYEDLTEYEKCSLPYKGDGQAQYLAISIDGRRSVYSDEMPPGEVHFSRGLNWIKKELLRAYVHGFNVGSKTNQKKGEVK